MTANALNDGEVDLVILGGGCAGLSLAMRLAELGAACPRTCIIEARAGYSNDRSWCFWDDGAARMQPLVAHRWGKMNVTAQGRSVTVDCGATPYSFLPAQAFYEAGLTAVASQARLTLAMSTNVRHPPSKVADGWRIDTDRGQVTAKMVIDTRPVGKPASGAAILWQSFFGHEIECEDAVFDAATAGLMHFAPGNDKDIRFTYVLPLFANRALVETTVFGPDPLSASVLTKELDAAVARATRNSAFRILRSEQGVLPMGATRAPRTADPTYIRAGLTVGGARPSTGYAFQRIQRWSDACAKRLAKGQLPLGHAPDPLLLQGMDQLFLSVLRARPKTGPAMFVSLFEKVDPARMIRFLSDGGAWMDYALVASALPVIPFIREIPAACLRTATWREALR